jgi:hypothetical protein
MSHVEDQARLFHGATGLGRLGFPERREGHIVPASKEVQFIPGTLTMAEKDKFSEHVAIVWLILDEP